jgi:TolB-like protein
MRVLSAILTALWLTPVRAQPPAAAAEQRVLIMKLRAVGTDAALMERVVTAYAGVISDRPGFTGVTAFDVADRLNAAAGEQTGALEQGCEDATCWELVDKAVGDARYVIGGAVGALGNELVVSLSLIDIDARRPIGSAAEIASDADDAVMAGPILLARLFGWEGESTGYVLPEDEDVSIAAIGLAATDIDDATAADLSERLAAALREIAGVEVVKEAERPDCEDVGCVSELGAALEVDKLVDGHVANLEGRYVITLRLIDARSATVDTRVTESFRGDPSQLVPAARFAGRRLLGVFFEGLGNMAVSSTEHSAALFINEEQRGALPMPALADLTPGLYRVRVTKSGFDDWVSDVYVEPEATTPVWAPLAEQPPKFYETWWFWTGVGAVVVGTATALVVSATALPGTELGNIEVR